MASETVALDSLSPQELVEVSKQLESEINGLMQNALALQQTAGKFASAGQAVEYFQDQKQGQQILLPLTESLYVSGTLESVDTVLIEIGTGYFVERSVEGGIDYYRRKVLFVKDKTEQLSQLIKARKTALMQVNGILERHVAAAQAKQ